MDSHSHFKTIGRYGVFMILCLSCCLFRPDRAHGLGGTGAASRGFKAGISRAMAATAALAEARVSAMEAMVRELGKRDEVRLFLSGEVMRDAPRPAPLALAWAMLADEEAESSVSGVPPDMQVHVSLRLRLGAGGEGTERLTRLLARPELLDLYDRALRLQVSALAEYDAAALFFLRPGALAIADRKAAAEASAGLSAAYAALEAAIAYLELLPALYPLDGGFPQDGGKELLPLVERLSGMNPDNYLLFAELARLRLFNGGALQAGKMLDKVIALRPDFAQAYDLRGLCLLWLELPSLALADFSRAIRMEPYHPGFYENRALTHRILENVPAMCEDLAESCRLGECAGLEWAALQGFCGQ